MKINYYEQLPDPFKNSAVDLYLHAFQDKLYPILGNDSRAQEVLKKNLDATHCLAAVRDQRLAGILAIKHNNGSFANPTLKTMIRAYGWSSGIYRMLGLALLDYTTAPDEVYIDGIAVVDDMQGSGIGSHLLKMLERMAIRDEIRKISLEVIDTNPRAEALYRRLGFEVIRQRTIRYLNFFYKFSFKSSHLMVKVIG